MQYKDILKNLLTLKANQIWKSQYFIIKDILHLIGYIYYYESTMPTVV